jgi:broad specificity phosphatase PhoE
MNNLTALPYRARLLLFVRHGQTSWTVDGKYQGHSDQPLTAEGIAAAGAIARQLRHVGIRRIVTSPSLRAAETAQIIADALGLQSPQQDERLREIAYGDWEGLTQQEVKIRWPGQLAEWKRSPVSFAFPHGESLPAVCARLDGFLHDVGVRFATDQGPLVAVSHSGPIRIAILRATGAPMEDFRGVKVTPASAHGFLLDRMRT